MSRYVILLAPSANRVYTSGAVAMVIAELTVLARGPLQGRIGEVAAEQVATVDAVGFTVADGDLSAADLMLISNLSGLLVLFRREPDGHLSPMSPRSLDRHDDDLISILKYQGKTNEHFTKLLLNVTVWSSGGWSADGDSAAAERRWTVLDPLCGRGTTLNQAVMYGWDAVGIDLDGKDFDAYARFLETWLADKRLRHKAQVTRMRRDGSILGRRFDARFAFTKEELKAGEQQTVTVFNVDTLLTAEVVRPKSVDVVVTDAPYGIRHGSTAVDRRSGGERLHRSPLTLLADAVPGWAAALRPGGAMGIAWNTRVAPRAEAVAVLADAGLEPLDGPGYADLCHRVDRTIVRDVIVARRPATSADDR